MKEKVQYNWLCVVGNLFAQMKMTLKKVLSFISDISSIRYNIWLTLMGKLATLL